MRLYDVDCKKVVEAARRSTAARSSAAIARKVKAALDPENLVDANTIVVHRRAATIRAALVLPLVRVGRRGASPSAAASARTST